MKMRRNNIILKNKKNRELLKIDPTKSLTLDVTNFIINKENIKPTINLEVSV